VSASLFVSGGATEVKFAAIGIFGNEGVQQLPCQGTHCQTLEIGGNWKLENWKQSISEFDV